MKRKAVHHKKPTHTTHKALSSKKLEKNDTYVVLVRGWIFLVLFAIMLGVGAIIGTYINAQLNNTPMVAGATTDR